MPSFDRSLKNKRLVFMDLDGTIYLGDELIDGAGRFLDYLKTMGIHHYFLSNNSSRSKADYVTKLALLGIQTEVDHILLSTDGVIEFLKEREIKDVYVVGTESMKEMFLEAGIQVTSPNPAYVVLGYDTELTYEKLRTSSLLLKDNVPLIATHPDLVCPTPEGPVPDVGAMLALYEKATGIKPERIFGKPNPEMITHVLKRHKLGPEAAVMIGDRIYTDLELAHRVSCDFILVLSGESKRSDLRNVTHAPALVVDTIGEIIAKVHP
ncbi:MAG: HAD-IIA family hydrolase [Candidatus Aminicenantes bacterium]|jgi:HAD superfamily hydrolase (TIGR01450 family)